MRELVPYQMPNCRQRAIRKIRRCRWDMSKLQNMPVGDYCRKRKLSERYVDDNICTVKDNPNKLLQEVNNLHPNLDFTLES